jgi:hypothetical protein
MQIPLEILKKQYHIECGKAYRGAFAKDGSKHVAVVIVVHENDVYYFSITSQEGTISSFKTKDCEAAVVQLSSSEQSLFWHSDPNAPKNSYIYCGKANLGQMKQDDFLTGLANRSITVETACTDSLFDRIKTATKNSKLYSPHDLKLLLPEEVQTATGTQDS